MVNKAHLAAGILACVLVACSGTDGTPGEKGAVGDKGAVGGPGANGKATEPSISLVSPRAAILNGVATVEITVDGTDVPSSSTVAFGAGIKVTKTTFRKRVITAEIEVDAAATPGLRDIVVETGSAKLTFAQGFLVAPAIGVKVSGGKVEQGGIVQLELQNNDAEYFDADNFSIFPSKPDALFAPLAYPFIGPKDARAILLVDPGAAVGSVGIIGTNYPDETNPPAYVGDTKALTITARTPETLGATEVSKVIATPFQSFLFKYSTAVNKLNVVTIAPNTAALVPFAASLGSTGKLDDILSTTASFVYPSTVAGSSTVVVANSKFSEAGASADAFGFKASVRTVDAAAPIAENDAAPHDGAGGAYQQWGTVPATGATVPALLLNGELKAADTADVYRVSGAANAQIEISVFTEAPVALAVSSAVNFPSGANTATLNVNAKAGTIVQTNAAGDRFIRVRPGPRRGKYTLGVRIRP